MHMESNRIGKTGSGVGGSVTLVVLLVVQLASQLCTLAKLNHAVCFRYVQFTED